MIKEGDAVVCVREFVAPRMDGDVPQVGRGYRVLSIYDDGPCGLACDLVNMRVPTGYEGYQMFDALENHWYFRKIEEADLKTVEAFKEWAGSLKTKELVK